MPDDTGAFDEAKLLAHCRSKLARYKQPKVVRVVETLPTTVFSKIDKKTLWAGW